MRCTVGIHTLIQQRHRELKGVIDRIKSGYFSHSETELFQPIVDSLLYDDQYMLLVDYQSYANCQEQVSRAYRNRDQWTQMSILN
jgi:glycogen phosphorylase